MLNFNGVSFPVCYTFFVLPSGYFIWKPFAYVCNCSTQFSYARVSAFLRYCFLMGFEFWDYRPTRRQPVSSSFSIETLSCKNVKTAKSQGWRDLTIYTVPLQSRSYHQNLQIALYPDRAAEVKSSIKSSLPCHQTFGHLYADGVM